MKLAKLVVAVAASGLFLHGGNLGGAQNLFVANGDSDSIERFNSAGAGTVFAGSGLSGPFGLAFDSASNFFVANSYVGTAGYSIEQFNSVGVGTVFAGPSTGLAQPVGLAFDSKGNLFVANEQNNTILTIIRELRELTPITSSSSRAALFLVLGLTC